LFSFAPEKIQVSDFQLEKYTNSVKAAIFQMADAGC